MMSEEYEIMKNLSAPPKIIVASMGDFKHNQAAIVKDKPFIDVLGQLFKVKRFNTALHGVFRGLNILMSFHPDKKKWRSRSHKNKLGFILRSQYFNRLFKKDTEAELVLQLGVLFNAGWKQINKPIVIYSDYTSWLSSQKPDSGRFPFRPIEYQRWFQLERDAYHTASLIFTRSKCVRNSIIMHYLVQPDKVVSVGAGVNPDMLQNRGQSAERKSNAPMILFIGKDFYRKGGDILLQAFQMLKPSYPELHMKMVTDVSLSKPFSIEGVEIIKPTWNRNFIKQLYEEASMFVLPSRLETWGDVLLEAMAAELPCIGSACDAISEIIVDQETGFVVENENAAALADAMRKLIENPDQGVLMGQKGRGRMKQFFTWDIVVQNMKKNLEQRNLISAR